MDNGDCLAPKQQLEYSYLLQNCHLPDVTGQLPLLMEAALLMYRTAVHSKKG